MSAKTPGKKIKRREALAIFFLGLIALLFFWRECGTGYILSYRDLSRYYYPLRLFTVSSIKSGILPLWNPCIFSGYPHFASLQSVVLYPLSIIYYIFPFDRAFNLYIVFHVFLGGAFTYLLAREWGYKPVPAVISGVTFMFSGFTISVMSLPTTLSSMIWLPLVFFFYTRALAAGARYIFFSSIALALMFLGGEPSIFYFTCWALFFYTIWQGFKNARGSIKTFFPVIAFSVLIVSFQLFPFLELLSRSDRRHMSPEYLTIWSMPIRDVANFIIPYFFGTDMARDAVIREQVWAPNIYAGAFTPLLVTMALFFHRDRRRGFLVALGGIFLILAFGKNTPLYLLASKVAPGMGMVRYPVRCLFMVNFCLAMLSGLGYEAYLGDLGDNGSGRIEAFFKRLLPFLLILSVLFLCLHLFRENIMLAIHNMLGSVRPGRITTAIRVDTGNMARFLGFFLTGAMLFYLRSRINIGRIILNGAFLSLVVVEFFTATSGLQGMVSPEIFHRVTPNIRALLRDKNPFRVYISQRMEHENGFLDREKPYGEAMLEVKDRLCTNRLMEHGICDAGGYESIRLLDYSKTRYLVDATRRPSDTNILNMLNVKYIGTLSELVDPSYRLVNKGAAYLYENKDVLPRAFLVGEYVVLRDEEDIFQMLKSKEFEPAREVILEEDPVLVDRPQSTDHSPQTEYVDFVKYTANEAVIDVVTDKPKFLVFSDQYYPGWKAYVDGRPAKIYKADFVLKAVYIDKAGAHTVRFVFDPFLFKLGLAISLAALLYAVWRVAFCKLL